jgi:hypothetical protein
MWQNPVNLKVDLMANNAWICHLYTIGLDNINGYWVQSFSRTRKRVARHCIELTREQHGPIYEETGPQTKHMIPSGLQCTPKLGHYKHPPCPTGPANNHSMTT